MLNLIKCEVYKLLKSRGMRILLVLFVMASIFFLGLSVLMGQYLTVQVGEEIQAMMQLDGTNSLYQAQSNSQVWLIMIAAAVSGIFVTEYRVGLLRNMVMSGKSRTQVYFSKLISTCIVASIIYWFSTLIYLATLSAIYGWGTGSVGKFLIQLVLCWFMFLAFTSFCLLISILTKHTAATIGICIGAIFVFAIVAAIGTIMQMFIPDNFLTDVAVFVGELFVGNLIALVGSSTITTGKLVHYLIVSIVTMAASTGGGLYLFGVKDLK